MAKYASFDSTLTIAPVTGWYDADTITYPNMPPATDLFTLTASQWAARTPGPWAVQGGELVPYIYPVPAPTLAQQATALLSAGLTITSTSTPAIDGTYPATPTAVSYVNAEMLSILANGTFADGATTLQWADATGALHTFPSVAVFKLFATAIGAFVAAATKVEIGASTTLPPSSVTIA
jgi:hypothetical protein